MSVIWVRGSGLKEASTADGGSRTFRWRGLVKSDTGNESRLAILAALPASYGSAHPEDPTCLCVKLDARQRQGAPKYWDADVEWNTLHQQNRDPREQQKQPDQRRPDWSYRFTPLQQYVTRDLDGNVFVDRAGTPFNPPPSVPIYIDEITVVRYEAQVDRQDDAGYMNSTNTDAWLYAKPNEALCQNIACHDVFEAGAWWAVKTYTMLISPRIMIEGSNAQAGGFDPVWVLNAGPKEIKGSGGNKKVVPIVDGGYVLGHPGLLDYYGRKIDTTRGGWTNLVMYLAFRTVNKRAFGPLNLVPPLW